MLTDRVALVLVCLFAVDAVRGGALPPPIVPMNMGVAFDSSNEFVAGEPAQMAATNWTYVQFDMEWSVVEPSKKGSYVFTYYDSVVNNITSAGMIPLITLTGNNALYNNGNSPSSNGSITAFVTFASAAVGRYNDTGALFELWDSPDVTWTPAPDAAAYVALAQAVGGMFMSNYPTGVLMGPATGTFNFDFIESTLQQDLLKYVNVLSFRSQQLSRRESYFDGFTQLVDYVQQYGDSSNPTLGIACTGWGFSANVTEGFIKPVNSINDTRQAWELASQQIVSVSAGTTLSVWYNWRDTADNTDYNSEFGVVDYTYTGSVPPFTAKLAYTAQQVLVENLGGLQFEERIQLGLDPIYPNEYAMLFADPYGSNHSCIAIWTADKLKKMAPVPLIGNFPCFSMVGATGEDLGTHCAAGTMDYIDLEFTTGPAYLTPVES